MNLEVDVDISGPIWEGLTEDIMRRYKFRVENVLGDRGVTDIKAYLPTQYMYLGHHGGSPRFNPIPGDVGTYQAGIHTERQSENELLIHDTPVVYGPWLEGVSGENLEIFPHHRNPPPRRFPGYHAFRLIAQVLNREAERIAQREIDPYIRELNA